jgi:alkanesulfonate monooxygenase
MEVVDMDRRAEPLQFGWFIPTYGDSAALGDAETWSAPGMELFGRVARAAEEAGFEYALVPVATECWEGWLTSMAVAMQTSKLKMLVAARPGLVAPTLMAKMIATFDQLTGGRVLINLIAGGGEAEMAADGLYYEHDERYEVMAESVSLMKRLWESEEPVTWEGAHFKLEKAVVKPKPLAQPPFYLGGISPAAKRVGAEHADVYLYWADLPERIAADVASVQVEAEKVGRGDVIRHGLRALVCVRETESEAWEAAENITSRVTGGMKDRRAEGMGAQSTADGRMRELASASESDGYRIAPHLWAGLTPVRHGAGVVIVGNPEQVAGQIEEYAEIGISSFCLSGWPHDEEAERFGRLVMPLIKNRVAQPG